MSVMNKLLTWMGLVDEGEPTINPGYGTRTDMTSRRPPQRSRFRIVDDQPQDTIR